MYNIIAHQIGCSDAQMFTKLGAGGNRDYPASVKVMTPRNELRTEDKKLRMDLMKAKGRGASSLFATWDKLHSNIAEQCIAYSSLELKMQIMYNVGWN